MNNELKRAGAALASNAFILGQATGPELNPEIRAALAAGCRAWDEAVRAASTCTGCDPAEGFCIDCRTAERATPAAASAGAAGTIAKPPRYEACIGGHYASKDGAFYLVEEADQHTAAAIEQVRKELEATHSRALVLTEMEARNAGQAQATEGGDLTDAQIVDVLASLGIDAEKSKHGFDVLQVRTTVPGIRDIVKAYRAATAPVSAAPTYADEMAGFEDRYRAEYNYMEGEEIRNYGHHDCAARWWRLGREIPQSAGAPVDKIALRAATCDDIGAMTKVDASMSGEEISGTIKGMFQRAGAPVSAAPTAPDSMRADYEAWMQRVDDDGEELSTFGIWSSSWKAATARASLPQSAGAPVSADDQFCDANCTWLDHAPGCVRAEAAPVSAAEPAEGWPAWHANLKDVLNDTKGGVPTFYVQVPAEPQALPWHESEDLRNWLRENSSGPYRKAAEAARYIEELERALATRQPQPLPTTYRQVVEWESARMEPDPAGEWVKRADLAMGQQAGNTQPKGE